MLAEHAGAVVRDNAAANRYEVFADGELAGFAVYVLAPERVIFIHTEIMPSYQGRGIGDDLVGAALDDVRRQGKRVIPLCPFVAGYIGRHPD